MELNQRSEEQLATVPLLSTVLRLDLPIAEKDRTEAISIIQSWVAKKFPVRKIWGGQSGVVRPETGEFEFSFADDGSCFATQLEHADAAIAERRWLVQANVERRAGDVVFELRLSIRQSKSLPFPAPRAPRLLSDLIRRVPITDAFPLTAEPAMCDVPDFESFNQLLKSPYRNLPLVAVSCEERSGVPLVDTDRLASYLAGTAHVVVLTPDASWALTNVDGKFGSVYGGAVRCYGPGYSTKDDPRKHRLWLAESILRNSSVRDSFIDQCLVHVFAQVTATYESFALPNPRAVKARTPAPVPLPAPVSTTATIQQVATAESEAIVEALAPLELPELSELRAKVLELESKLIDSLSQNTVIEKLESELQELRSQNAELNKMLEEEHAYRDLFERDNTDLNERIKVLTGQQLDPSQPGAGFLRALGDAVLSAQVLIEDYGKLRTVANEIDAINTELLKAREDNFSLRSTVASLRSRTVETDVVTNADSVKLADSDSLQRFFEGSPNVELTNKALRSYRSYPYLDSIRLSMVLRLIRDVYVPMRLGTPSDGDGLHQKFQETLTNERLKYGPTATDSGSGMAKDDHKLKVGERWLDLYKIRDITKDFNWQHFLCIYFVWDDETQRLYVHSFGHGDSPSARS